MNWLRRIAGSPALQLALGGLVLAAAMGLGLFVPVDNALRDWRFSIAPQQASGNTVFVDIDSASLQRVGVWPWPRSTHAQLLDELMALGANSVAFDIDFSLPSDEAGDAAFARALADAGGYALLAAFQQQSIGGLPPAINMPLPRFAQHADPVAVNVNLDADGLVRNYPLGMWLDGRWVPSIATMLGNLAPSSQGALVIDFAIDPASVPRIRAADLLAHKVPRDAIAGRNVVVGASAVELRDFFVVPRHGVVPGALLQIVATETVLQSHFLMPVGLWTGLLALGIAMAVGLWLRSRGLWFTIFACTALSLAIEVGAALLHIRYYLLADTASLQTGLAFVALSALVAEVGRRGAQHARATRERDGVRVILDRVIADNFDGVVIVAEDGRIVTASQSASVLIGRELTGGASRDSLPAGLAAAVVTCFTRGTVGAVREVAIDTPGGRRQLEYATTLSPLEIDGQPRKVVSLTFRDITERRAAEDRLVYLSRHDPLTGALNRAALIEEARHRLAAGTQLSLVLLDLRRFRAINDTLGHAQGDLLLRLVVSRLATMGPDVVARLGADNFALLAPELDPAALGGYCNSIAEWLSFPYQLDNGHRAIIAASAGATTSVLSGPDIERMLSHADMALSAAKQAAGNGTCLFEPQMEQRLTSRQTMDAALRDALRDRAFSVAYQPQVDLRTGRIIGAEALCRWIDPTLGPVSPADFIAAAEETGLIVELGAFVLESACAEAARWNSDLHLAVNVSPVQFELADMAATIARVLDESGLDPSRLDIEITEGVFVRNAVQVTAALERIRALGVGIALDDFGTGYSSLAYLGRLPVDKIKIDQRFVRGLPADAEAGAIVSTILGLSRALGKTTVAEGIETAAQRDLLRAAGCDTGQGYLFARPLPAPAFRTLTTPTLAATG